MKAELVLGNLKRERDGLEGKLERLHSALCKEWQDETQEYLCNQQYNAMSVYAHILDERIADIEYKLEQKKAKNETVDQHETCHCDKNIFKEKIDMDSYKKYMEESNKDEDDFLCEDPACIVIEIIRDVFGKDIL